MTSFERPIAISQPESDGFEEVFEDRIFTRRALQRVATTGSTAGDSPRSEGGAALIGGEPYVIVIPSGRLKNQNKGKGGNE